jgi:hypothetical protein
LSAEDDRATDQVTQSRDPVDLAWDALPESKLALWDVRLLVGAGLVGSQALLGCLLQTLGVRAVLPLASLDAWWDAHSGVSAGARTSNATGVDGVG